MIEIKKGFNSYKDCFEDIIILNGEYLTDAIGDDYWKWSYLKPVFFASSTGTGKSTLMESIIKTCIEMKQDVLMLTNRSAIDLALKKRSAKKLNRTKILDNNTNQGLRQLDNIGDNLYIMTYQKFSKLIDNKNSYIHKLKFKLVICDEIGFVNADSLISTETSKIIKYIVLHFSESIRCYLSATPNPIFSYINALEKENFKNREYNCTYGNSCHDCSFTKYKSPMTCDRKLCLKYYYDMFEGFEIFDPEQEFYPLAYELIKGYDYLKINYVKSFEEIIKIIKDGQFKSKCVVFFDTIENGKRWHEDLPNSIYIDANTKNIRDKNNKNKEGYDYIIDHETFEQNTLLCSSTFDCGINLRQSSGISNIVVSSEDPNQFIQMIGRIRVKKGNIVNLFIVDISKEEISTRLKSVERKLHAIKDYKKSSRDFEEKYYNESNNQFNYKTINGFFKVQNGKVSYNEAAEIELKYSKEILENLLKEFEDKNENAYIKTALRWLGRENDYSIDNWVNYKSNEDYKLEFKKFVKEKIGIIKRKDYENFRKDFFEKFIVAYGLDVNESKDEIFAIKKINKKFNMYNLKYELLSHAETFYTLEKTIDDKKFKPKNRYEEVFVGYLDDNLGDIEEDDYKIFIEDFMEIYLHAYIKTSNVETNKEFSINKINLIFKDNGLMYKISKHSGSYYELKNINDNESNGNAIMK